MDKNLPKIRTLPSMLVALKPTIWYGILAPATAQLPSLESKSSVESRVIQPPVTRNTWTQECLSGFTNRLSYPAVSSFYVACASVTYSAHIKRLEILHPALESIYWHCGPGVTASSDDHCLGVGIIYCTGTSVTITNMNRFWSSGIFFTYPVLYFRLKPGSWLPSGLIRDVVFLLPLSYIPSLNLS